MSTKLRSETKSSFPFFWTELSRRLYLFPCRGGHITWSQLSRDTRNFADALRTNLSSKSRLSESQRAFHLADAKRWFPKPANAWNVPQERNPVFTGREELLNQLRADLLKNNKQALSGLGGIGKTQIAVEYAYRYRDGYAAALWTFADSEQSVNAGFANIAKLLDLPEKDSAEQALIVAAVKRWLQHNDGWLLVFDNADTPGTLAHFFPQEPKGHILLTSRAHVFQTLGILKLLEVSVLSPQAAVEFLLRRTAREGATELKEVEALAEQLGYLPLALEQAAAYIVENQSSFKNYLTSYQNKRLKLLEKQGPVLGSSAEQQKSTVATTWAVNFTHIEKSFPASADLLRISAFLAPDAIPLELLEGGGSEMGERLGPRLAEAKDDPLVLDELLNPLISYSLVRRNLESRSFSIHPLVQEVMRDGATDKQKESLVQRAVKAVSSEFSYPEFQNWTICDRLLPHALACARLMSIYPLELETAAQLLRHTGCYLRQRAGYEEAEPLFLRALAIDEKILGPQDTNTAKDLNELANLYYDEGRYGEAEILRKRSLKIVEETLGPEHPWTATAMSNLALLYDRQGKYEEAEPLYRRSLGIQEKVLGSEHPDTSQSLNNLALLHHHQGRHEEAERLYRRSLAICEKALGPEHPDTAVSLNNLAGVYSDQGRYAEAELLYRRSLTIWEKTTGSQHPNTAATLQNLANLYRAQGRYEESESLYRRSLTIREDVLGPEHDRTAATLNNLATLYAAQHRYEEAEPLYRRAVAIAKKVLGPSHPDTRRYTTNLISCYRDQGKLKEAEELEQRIGNAT